MPNTTGSPPPRHPCPVCGGFTHPAAVEDYLAALYRLTGRREDTSTTALATRLGWPLPTVSTMHRRQGAAGLIVHPTTHRTELTGHGRHHARNVVRRNRLVKTFLAERLSLPWTELPIEADRLEHAVGMRLEARLDRALGYPRSDPFGSPIPLPAEDQGESWPDLLTAVLPCRRFTVLRIADHDPAVLELLAEAHIGLHTVLTDVVFDPDTDLVCFDSARHRHILPLACAQQVHGRSG
ncbi:MULTISPECIES: metal-dependent transcriptional regulator [Rhodococcus]|uniref:Metal-dependent transcriptional regulator n=1 Tax=Rhodococcus chondri TaxID=3065941 RepID=A0ABU7JUM4_9NOCA|nr:MULTISPECIES: metal-dependent transcriptional regulator [Rhodococcus]MEE2033565.1 metal-dependent transcriptional regulator [Rhodococcus sp. CC-R104]QQM55658.1 metal-dependent transcriptional regulator [Rhodococcus pyridinivorans]